MEIPVEHGQLETVLREPRGPIKGAAMVCHPHPLQGGTMHTRAVYRVAQVLADINLVACRFNFRGVCKSTGVYDGGAGEQDDARATLSWLEERYPSTPLMAGGFSFGSMVALKVGLKDPRVKALVGFGVPVRLYDYSFLKATAKPTLLIQGSQDEFGTAEELEQASATWGPAVTVETIQGADHYFNGKIEQLKQAVADYFIKGAGGKVL